MPHPRIIPQPALTALLLGLLVGCSTPPRGPDRPTTVSVSITPASATLSPGGEQRFTATVTGPANTSVTWTANGGALAANGNTVTYSAPADPGTYQVTAASVADPSKAASATVTVEPPKPPLTTVWTRQFGREGFDTVHAIAAGTDGDVFVVGAEDTWYSPPPERLRDAFALKIEAGGNEVTQLRFSSIGDDAFLAAAVDPNGQLIAAGYTWGGATDPSDAYVATYTSHFGLGWDAQFGSPNADGATGVTVDADGNVLVVGFTQGDLHPERFGETDAFVRKLDGYLDVMWSHQFGAAGHNGATGVAVDADGNVLVTGWLNDGQGSPDGPKNDAFIRKYGPTGTLLWEDRFGTNEADAGTAVAVDSHGNVLVVGTTSGDLAAPQAGFVDAFVRLYGPNGAVKWTDQFGGASNDAARSAVVDTDGGFLVLGSAGLALDGAFVENTGMFIRKYAADGTVVWTYQFGSGFDDSPAGIVLDAAGNIYVAGGTNGDLGGPNAGGTDGFIRKFAQ